VPDLVETLHADACLAALKAATREAHDRVEAVAGFARLAAPGVTIEDYGAALQRLHRHFARHEPPLLRRLSGHLPEAALAQRRSLEALSADLTDLGLAALPVLPGPEIDSVAAAAGWLYVHEGTSLGGLVVLHGLRRHLGARLGSATRYYQRHGKETAQVWKETRRLIAGLLPDAEALAGAICGASAAFAAMQREIEDAAPRNCVV